MAKKDKNADPSANVGKKKGKAGLIIFLAVLLVFVGGGVAIFAFNVFDLRDGQVFPLMRQIPFVGDFIPGEQEYEYVEIDGVMVAVPVAQPEEEVEPEDTEEVLQLRAEVEMLQAALNEAQTLNGEQATTIAGLASYQASITQYRDERDQFEEMIARSDPDAFATFFESVDPDRAAAIFAEILANREVDRVFRQFANTYATMDVGDLAELFTTLLPTNSDLVIAIYDTFNVARRAEVLAELPVEDRATITLLTEPTGIPIVPTLPEIPIIDGTDDEFLPVLVILDTEEDVEEELEEELEEETEET
ncbi:MAG: hypothetical protein FWG65_05145 [Turicibacter sp.]|nr:hypothetical protein [Turicibacter sp.]